MGYTHLDKLLNVILKLKYNWISKIDIPYHYETTHGDVYYVHIYVNDNILKILDDPKLFPKNQYKIPLDLFEKKTRTSFKTLKKDIDNLFRSQILSGQVDQDIWIFVPEHLR